VGEMDGTPGCGREDGRQKAVEARAYERRVLVDGVDVCGT
jgi:hypothetical protein